MNRFLTTVVKQCQPRFYFVEVLKEKEKGDQKHYFTKEDQKLMSKLLKKMKESNELINRGDANEEDDREQLQDILSRYRVTYTESLVEEILKWKRDD